MKLRKILKSMWANYCRTFKDVPPAPCSDKKPASAGFVSCGNEGQMSRATF